METSSNSSEVVPAEDDARERAMGFLESMESRHNDILDQLEELNGKIEQVLEECTQRSKEPDVAA